ncbi:hypothetical protein T01_698 [Trichinella spiralis]|uniref:Uncharacterized protein n=1 Tax=Trichinella spiralis TaxID=6334 RepID=A0A0V1BD78_TRISP|nr:hypothetical protein T01_698 [Trichinella spiralis]
MHASIIKQCLQYENLQPEPTALSYMSTEHKRSSINGGGEQLSCKCATLHSDFSITFRSTLKDLNKSICQFLIMLGIERNQVAYPTYRNLPICTVEIILSISETTAYCKIVLCQKQAVLCQLKKYEITRVPDAFEIF